MNMDQDRITVIQPLPMISDPWEPGREFQWYFMKTEVQPEGFVIHLTQRVRFHPWKKAWLIGWEIFPNVTEIRTATREEVERHWGAIQPATQAQVTAARQVR